jgi:hypothetical protein
MPARTAKPINPFIGRWRIVEMEMWDKDYIDMEGPGEINFGKRNGGSFRFGAVEADLDSRVSPSADGLRLDFSWAGSDEMDPVFGRGWAILKGDELHGHLFFHRGDDTSFRAIRASRSNSSPSGREEA